MEQRIRVAEILFDHHMIHIPPEDGLEKQVVEAILQLIREAQIEELEAIAGYTPVTEAFDYREYARNRLAKLKAKESE